MKGTRFHTHRRQYTNYSVLFDGADFSNVVSTLIKHEIYRARSRNWENRNAYWWIILKWILRQ
jgi:hypothetical protein